MKKLSFLLFILALVIGSIAAFKTGFGKFGFGKNESKKVRVEEKTSEENKSEDKKDLSGFSKIEIMGPFNTEISVGKDFSVKVEADEKILQNVKTEIEDDTLKIYMQGNNSFQSNISVKISMPNLEKIEVNGASKVSAANIKGESLEVKANGASTIKVEGSVQNLDAEAVGASTIDAENLKTESAEVNSIGASTVTVSPSNSLNAEAVGASTIIYAGEPTEVKQESSGASSIKKK